MKLEGQEYDRTWGTYIGPAGTDLGHSHMNYFQLDANENFHFYSNVKTNSSYSTAYYSQFVTAGPAYDLSQFSNFYMGSFNSTGGLISAQYADIFNYNQQHFSFDSLGNTYGLQFANAGMSAPATAGTWFPMPEANEADKVLFSKQSPTGTLLWKTYLPNDHARVVVNHDPAGNTYIVGNTNKQAGFSTPGVFQENYEVIYDPNSNIQPNTYVAKLDANGSLVWATYFPAALVYSIKFHNGFLYLLGGWDRNPNGETMATAGAFQAQKSICTVTKLNADTGTRVWGTYYGPTGAVAQLPSGIEVNSSGIYLIGDIIDYAGGNGAYFGTPGSHQPSLAGESDIYLSKFSLDGARLWSTHFGGPGEEYSAYGVSPLALMGNDVILTFTQYSNGNVNLATPGAYIDTMPVGSFSGGAANLVFAQFNENGIREWTSYYGGASTTSGYAYPPSINVVTGQGTFYLYGSTLADTGITTPGAAQIAKLQNERTGFIARFDSRAELSNSEVNLSKDLVLYNNPNSGNFHLAGSVLQKLQCYLKIYDASGRVAFQQKLTKDSRQIFNLEHQLTKGNYFLEVSAESNGKIKTFKMIVK